MDDERREVRFASYADRGEAMAVQALLDAHGIRARLDDYEGMPSHVFGVAGALARPVSLFLLESDVARAEALIGALGEQQIDEDELARQALAAGHDDAPAGDEDSPGDEGAPAGTAPAPPPTRAIEVDGFSPPPAAIHPGGWGGRVALALALAALTFLALRLLQ